MIMKLFAVFIAAMTLAGGVATAQEENQGRGQRQGQRSSGRRNQTEMLGQWAKVQEQLKAKDPKAYEEVRKLASENVMAAFAKLREYSVKAGIKLPSGGRQGGGAFNERGGRQGGGAFNERGGRGGRGAGMAGGMAGGGKRAEFENTLKQKYPDEYAVYRKTADAASEQLKALAKKAGMLIPATQSDIQSVLSKYPDVAEAMKTDFRDGMEKLRAALEKEGFEMNPFRGGMTPGGRGGMRGRGGSFDEPPKRENAQLKLNQVRRAYPEEFKKFVELQKTDRAAARKYFESLAKKLDSEKAVK